MKWLFRVIDPLECSFECLVYIISNHLKSCPSYICVFNNHSIISYIYIHEHINVLFQLNFKNSPFDFSLVMFTISLLCSSPPCVSSSSISWLSFFWITWVAVCISAYWAKLRRLRTSATCWWETTVTFKYIIISLSPLSTSSKKPRSISNLLLVSAICINIIYE